MNRNNNGKLIVRLFVFVVSLVLVGADLTVSAQNSNSSTTTQEDSSAQNDNTSDANMNRAGRRRRRRGRNQMTPAPPQLPANGTLIIDPALRRSQTGRCDPMTQEQTDLSGTYTGRVGYTDVVMAGDATLTISGNSFTLTNGQMTAEGRIVAVTTCNYTAVTMRFGKDAAAAPGQPLPPTVSLRARHTGGGLSLETVPGESRMFSFTTTGGGKSGFRGGMKKGGPPPVGIKPPTE